MPPNTLILIPAFNEEAALPSVLKELAAVVPQHDVLVIDDGSSDATAEVARSAGATVARLPFNLGIGGALRTGFRYAFVNGYERAVQFDGDGQHDGHEIARLLEGLDRGADVVIGSRFAGDAGDYPLGAVRGGAIRFLRLAMRLVAGRRFSDTSSGFRAFGRAAIEFFAHTYPVEFLDSVEALLLAVYAGFDIVEVPARMRLRAAGTPSNQRLKLIYHYLRLLIVIATTTSLKGRRGKSNERVRDKEATR